MIRFTAPHRDPADSWDHALDALTDAGLPRDPTLIDRIEGDGWPDGEGVWPYRLVLTDEAEALLHAEAPERPLRGFAVTPEKESPVSLPASKGPQMPHAAIQHRADGPAMPLESEVVGIGDIHARLAKAGRPVTLGTISSWRHRSRQPSTERPMPEPDGYLSGSIPWWWWSETMLPWLTETGRIGVPE